MSNFTPPLVTVTGVTKRFGALTALSDINLHIRSGEVLALLGDNGAGKSTFIKILAGAQPASEGVMTIDGKPVVFSSPGDAADAGIATIFQELALSENLSVTENVFLGREIVRRIAGIPFLRRKTMKDRVATLLTELDAHISDPEAPVGSLSGGQRQAVAICRALNVNARLVIMDEPTAALAVAETRKVLATVRRLSDRGCAVVLISQLCRQILDGIDILNRRWAFDPKKRHPLMDLPNQLIVTQISAGEHPASIAGRGEIVVDVQYLPSEETSSAWVVMSNGRSRRTSRPCARATPIFNGTLRGSSGFWMPTAPRCRWTIPSSV